MKIPLLICLMTLSLAGFCQPKSYTIVFLNKKADKETVDKETITRLMADHMANMNRLAREGKLYPRLIRRHNAYVKEHTAPSDVVTEAIFGENEGGILVVKSELPADAFANDPGVQHGLMDVKIKKLYIAKSSFCEK